MKKFVAKVYLNNEINQENCGHELLSTSGFDEGMYGTTYKCIICGSRIHYGIYEHQDVEGKYIFQDYGWLTKNNINLIRNMLTFISNRYINENNLDIASIFNEISPYLDKISDHLNKPTDIDKNLEKEKFQKVYQKKK